MIPLVKILKNQEYCEMVLKKDVKDAYLLLRKHDGLCWYKGLVEKSQSVIVELSLNRVIEVDIASHTAKSEWRGCEWNRACSSVGFE